MSRKYDAQEMAEMQTTLVAEFLELMSDANRDPHPDSLRICSMLLAGSAELRDPPDSFLLADPPSPSSYGVAAPESEYCEQQEAADLDALLPEYEPEPEESNLTPEKLAEAVNEAPGPHISFDGSRPNLPAETLIEAKAPDVVILEDEDAPPSRKKV